MIVGSAEVVVRAITNKVRGDIERAFADARPAVQKAGQQAGQDFAKNFETGSRGGIEGAIDRGLERGIDNSMQAGREAGSQFGSEFEKSVSGIDIGGAGRRMGEDFGREAGAGFNSSSGGLDNSVRRTASSAGSGGGSIFGRAFNSALNSEFAKTAPAASAAFTSIFAGANIAGAGIAVLISSLSAVVSGLYSIVSAAGVAAGSLAVLPGIMAALGQGLATVKLAFGGVGAALKAGIAPQAATAAATKASTAATQDNTAAQTAARAAANAIADARKALARATQDAAYAQAQAADRVNDAERDVAEAQRDVLNVQKQLNAARKEAAETLQQLAFSAEDAVLGQERAQLSLEDAYTKLQAVQDLPADSRARREAELAYKEAELAFREAKDRNADLAAEQRKAAKAGIEGSSEVIDAQNAISDAKKSLADKEEALADARQAAAKQELDSARSIADAQQAVARAREAAANAARQANVATGGTGPTGGVGAVNAYQQALSNLSPAARTFVEYLISIKDRFKDLRAAAGERLFPLLQVAIQNLIDNALPDLENGLRRTGGLLGELAVGFSKGITEGDNFKRVLDGSNDTIGIFARKGADGRNSAQQLSEVMLRLLVAVQPLTQRFARFIAHLITLADKATNTRKEMNGLGNFFDKAGDRAALLGDIIKNLFGVIVTLGGAADASGEGLLVSFDRALIRLRRFLELPETQADLRKYFADVADNVRSIGNALNRAGAGFLSLGDNPGIKKFFDDIGPAIDNFTKIGDNLTASGGGLAKFINNISTLLVAFADTQGLNAFFNTLNKGFDVLFGTVKAVANGIDAIFGEGSAKKIFITVGVVLAVARALSFMRIVGRKAFQVLLGGPIGFINNLRKGEGAIGKFVNRLRGISNTRADESLDGMGRASDRAKAALERQMVTDNRKIGVLKALEVQTDKTALALERMKLAGAPGVGAAASPVRQAAAPAAAPAAAAVAPAAATAPIRGNVVIPPAAAANASKAAASTGRFARVAAAAGKPLSLLSRGFGALSFALLGVSGPVAAIIGGIVLLVIGLKKLYGASPEFRKFVDGIVDKLQALGKWFKEILLKYVVPFLDGMFKKVNEVLPKIGKFFGDVFDKIGPVIAAVVKFIGDHWKLLLPIFGIIIGPLGVIIGLIISNFGLVKKVIGEVVGFIGRNWRLLLPIFAIVLGPIGVVVALVVANFGRLKDAVGAVIDFFQNFFPAVRIVVTAVINAVKEKIAEIIVKMAQVVSGVRGKIGAVGEVFGKVREAIAERINAIKAKVAEVVTKIQDVIGGVRGKIARMREVFDKIRAAIADKINAIKTKLAEVIAKIQAVIAGIRGKIENVREVFDKIRQAVADKVNSIKAKFGEIVGKVQDVIGGIRGKIEGVRNVIESIVEVVRNKVDAIKNKFGQIVGAVGAAFGGLKEAAGRKLQAFIDFLNNKFISNVNKVTSKFGLTISPIPGTGYAEGGWTGPGGKNKIAGIVHADEYVIPKSARRAIEKANPGALEYMRKTGEIPQSVLPMGDWGPLGAIAGDIKDGVNKTWNSFENLAKSGVGKVLETMVKSAESLMDGAGINRGIFVNDFAYGIMDKLAEAARRWGDSKQSIAESKALPPNGGDVLVSNPSNPAGLMNWKGGTFTRLFVAHMQRAEQLAGQSIYVTQGGFRPTTSYSGSTHNKDAIDLQVSAALITALRRVGIAAGDRTGLGNWAPHVHAVPGPGAGYASPSALGQFANYLARGGARQSLNSAWGLARGGLVHATPGGILANIGEAGRNERVEPLALDGFSSRDRAIVDLIEKTIASRGEGGDTYKIYPSPGMDEVALAHMVSRRQAFRRSAGT